MASPGRIGIVARTPSLACEAERQLPMYGLGTSKVIDLSANHLQGVTLLESLKMFEGHWGTDAVLLLGAIDPGEEPACTDWIARHMRKPVIAYIEGADRARAQRERLAACGVHLSPDAAGIGALAASLVPLPWLPFD